jgi:hypothetical protein
MNEIDCMGLSESERLEAGLSISKGYDRPKDNDMRVLIFTACYFVLDGVTLTIRRLEGHLRSRGATVKILSTVPDDIEQDKIKVIFFVVIISKILS